MFSRKFLKVASTSAATIAISAGAFATPALAAETYDIKQLEFATVLSNDHVQQSDLLTGDTARIYINTAKAGGTETADIPGTWASSDPGVIEIDAQGNIKAIAKGTAQITFTPAEGSSVTTTPEGKTLSTTLQIRETYQNCAAAYEAGVAPIKSDARGYGIDLDSNQDGVGCEDPVDYTNTAPATDVIAEAPAGLLGAAGARTAAQQTETKVAVQSVAGHTELAKTGIGEAGVLAVGLGMVALGGASILVSRRRSA